MNDSRTREQTYEYACGRFICPDLSNEFDIGIPDGDEVVDIRKQILCSQENTNDIRLSSCQKTWKCSGAGKASCCSPKEAFMVRVICPTAGRASLGTDEVEGYSMITRKPLSSDGTPAGIGRNTVAERQELEEFGWCFPTWESRDGGNAQGEREEAEGSHFSGVLKA